jgi:hypothetical protein
MVGGRNPVPLVTAPGAGKACVFTCFRAPLQAVPDCAHPPFQTHHKPPKPQIPNPEPRTNLEPQTPKPQTPNLNPEP